MDHINERELLHCLMDLGEVMVKSGAETNRVEDTLNRMGKAYGAVRMDVFAITSSMVVSMQMEGGKEWTLTRRIRKPAVMDFTRLECCNALSRRCCSEVMDLDTLSEEIKKIRELHVSAWTDYFGSIVVAGAFCMFFGGTLQDALVAVAFAVIICLFQSKLERFCPTRVVFNFLAAAIGGLLVWAVYLLAMNGNRGVFWSALVAALCGGIYGDVMARVYKTPSTIFFIPAVIPLVPGSNLYYTLFYTVYKDIAMAKDNAVKTILFSFAIAVGISIVATWLHMWRACRGRSQGAWG